MDNCCTHNNHGGFRLVRVHLKCVIVYLAIMPLTYRKHDVDYYEQSSDDIGTAIQLQTHCEQHW